MRTSDTIVISCWTESEVTCRIEDAEKRGYILKKRGGGVDERLQNAAQKFWALMKKEEVVV